MNPDAVLPGWLRDWMGLPGGRQAGCCLAGLGFEFEKSLANPIASR